MRSPAPGSCDGRDDRPDRPRCPRDERGIDRAVGGPSPGSVVRGGPRRPGGRCHRGRGVVATRQRRAPGCGKARRRWTPGAAPGLAVGRRSDGRLRHLRSRPRPGRPDRPDPLRPVRPGRGLDLGLRDGRGKPPVRVVHPRRRARDRGVRPGEPGHRVDLPVGRGSQPGLPDLGGTGVCGGHWLLPRALPRRGCRLARCRARGRRDPLAHGARGRARRALAGPHQRVPAHSRCGGLGRWGPRPGHARRASIPADGGAGPPVRGRRDRVRGDAGRHRARLGGDPHGLAQRAAHHRVRQHRAGQDRGPGDRSPAGGCRASGVARLRRGDPLGQDAGRGGRARGRARGRRGPGPLSLPPPTGQPAHTGRGPDRLPLPTGTHLRPGRAGMAPRLGLAHDGPAGRRAVRHRLPPAAPPRGHLAGRRGSSPGCSGGAW